MRRLLAGLVLLLAATAARADVPPVLLPSHADTLTTNAPSAPLIVPGRAPARDSSLAEPSTPAQRAIAQYAFGRRLERDGHGGPAIAAYRNAVRLDPTIPDAHFRMGVLYTAVQQHRAAADEYAAELAHAPDRVDASRALGAELAALGDTAHAIARLQGLTQRDSSDWESWRALSYAYAVSGRPHDAELAVRRALAIHDDDAPSWRDLATLLSAARKDGDARTAFARAARLDPADAAVWINLGNLEHRTKHLDKALADYQHAVTLDSTLALGWRGQLAVLAEQHRPNEAGVVYRRWLEQVPEQPSLRMEAMRYFDALGRKDIALELARDGVRATPRSGEAHLALGMALHESGNDRGALAEFRRAEINLPRPEQRANVVALIRSLRARAPDSLRTMFAADSVRNERPAGAHDALPVKHRE